MQPTGTDSPAIAGRYRLGPRLGRGGMADVFEAFDERLARPVAIKLLRPEMTADPGMRARFEREARSAASLNHPNVVAVYDSGEEDGRAFLVMERLPGETLADRVRSGPVDPDWLRGVAADVLSALDAAHQRGIVHRDIKPGNILLDPDGRAKVGDFGIAKAIRDSPAGVRSTDPAAADLTAVGMLVGTVAYLSPEQIQGEPASPRSDLYGLGVVLYEALTGRKPYPGGEAVAQARAVVEAAAPDVAELRPDVPPDLAAVVRRAMSRDPKDRFASARSMRAALLGDTHAGTRLLPTAALPGAGPLGVAPGAGGTRLTAALPGPSQHPVAGGAGGTGARPPTPTLAPTAVAPRSGLGGATPPPPGARRADPGPRRGRARRVIVGTLAVLAVVAMLTAVALAGHDRGRDTAASTPTATGRTTTTTAAPSTTTTLPPTVSALLAEARALDAVGGTGPTALAALLEEVATTPAAQRAGQASVNAQRAEQLLYDQAITESEYAAALSVLEGAGATAPTSTTTSTSTTTTTTTSTTTTKSKPGKGPPGKGQSGASGNSGPGGPGGGGPGKGAGG